jgi:CarD family transcriptional regulator
MKVSAAATVSDRKKAAAAAHKHAAAKPHAGRTAPAKKKPAPTARPAPKHAAKSAAKAAARRAAKPPATKAAVKRKPAPKPRTAAPAAKKSPKLARPAPKAPAKHVQAAHPKPVEKASPAPKPAIAVAPHPAPAPAVAKAAEVPKPVTPAPALAAPADAPKPAAPHHPVTTAGAVPALGPTHEAVRPATPPRPPAPRPAGEMRPGMPRPGQVMLQNGRPVAPQRAAAKEESFAEGDYVVYPTHGVGKVERIATEDIAGHRLELIHITFEENRMTLRVPVAKARSAGLRKLATRKMFDEAMGVLKGRARIKRTMWSRRAQEYEAKINSGDPIAIAEVVRDLHRNAGQPDQSFSERQIYEAAMDRLAAELAALDQTDKLAASVKLTNFLKTL